MIIVKIKRLFCYFVGVEAVSASSTIFFRKGEIKLGIEVR
jgi:hypothetical protein